VIHASFGFAEALGRVGIERRLYTAGAKKSLLDPFRPERPEDVERLNAILHELHQGFKATVRERRGARLKGGDEELFEGQIWTGRRALEAGLIDGLGDLHAVLRERFGDKVKLPLISIARPWWQRRLGFEAWPRALVDAALDSLAERELWSRYGL
jgi:ClpP class serine protease